MTTDKQKIKAFVKKKGLRDVLDSEFESIDCANLEFNCWLKLADEIYIQILDGEVSITDSNLEVIAELDDTEKAYWWKQAEFAFEEEYAEQIEESRRENAYNSWLDYQDSLGEYDRHGY